jgi:hypothetical protein
MASRQTGHGYCLNCSKKTFWIFCSNSCRIAFNKAQDKYAEKKLKTAREVFQEVSRKAYPGTSTITIDDMGLSDFIYLAYVLGMRDERKRGPIIR